MSVALQELDKNWTLSLEIPEVAPSTNRLMRMHWAARNRLLKKWQWLIWLEVFRLGFPSLPPGKLKVRITRCSHHVMDADNLAGAAKVVLDALRAANLIVDDSPSHIDLTCEQESGPALTRIQLTASTGSRDEPLKELFMVCKEHRTYVEPCPLCAARRDG